MHSLPRLKLKCCCVDCLQRINWCEQQGGPKVPLEHAERKVPIPLIYMANRFQVLRGADKLSFYKLRDDAECSMCITTCCHTLMFADHPCYSGNVLVGMPAAATWQGLEEKEAEAYIQIQDWDPEDYVQLEPKLPGSYTDHMAAPEEKFGIAKPGSLEPDDKSLLMEIFGPFFSPPPEGPGIQFKDLPGAETPWNLGLAEDRSSKKLQLSDSSAAGGA